MLPYLKCGFVLKVTHLLWYPQALMASPASFVWRPRAWWALSNLPFKNSTSSPQPGPSMSSSTNFQDASCSPNITLAPDVRIFLSTLSRTLTLGKAIIHTHYSASTNNNDTNANQYVISEYLLCTKYLNTWHALSHFISTTISSLTDSAMPFSYIVPPGIALWGCSLSCRQHRSQPKVGPPDIPLVCLMQGGPNKLCIVCT